MRKRATTNSNETAEAAPAADAPRTIKPELTVDEAASLRQLIVVGANALIEQTQKTANELLGKLNGGTDAPDSRG